MSRRSFPRKVWPGVSGDFLIGRTNTYAQFDRENFDVVLIHGLVYLTASLPESKPNGLDQRR